MMCTYYDDTIIIIIIIIMYPSPHFGRTYYGGSICYEII
jgi:hypothetical protein